MQRDRHAVMFDTRAVFEAIDVDAGAEARLEQADPAVQAMLAHHHHVSHAGVFPVRPARRNQP
jgi:hypothetical protein